MEIVLLDDRLIIIIVRLKYVVEWRVIVRWNVVILREKWNWHSVIYSVIGMCIKAWIDSWYIAKWMRVEYISLLKKNGDIY